MLRAVLDTNTIISALFWEGNEAKLFRKIENGKIKLYLSLQILGEVEKVIKRQKFSKIMDLAGISPEIIIEKIISLSNVIIPKIEIDICRDPKDNKFLECAKTANADYLITGDEDLLILREYEGIHICRTIELLKKI